MSHRQPIDRGADLLTLRAASRSLGRWLLAGAGATLLHIGGAVAQGAGPVPGASDAAPSATPSPAGQVSLTGSTLSLSPSWSSLTPSQKECLAPLAKEWDQLDSALKGKWLEIAARYPKLSPEHQQRLRERMVAWTRMTPTERQKARIGYQHAGELRSEEQASRLQAKWEAYQALSPDAKQRLAERAAEKASERAHAKPGAPTANKLADRAGAPQAPAPAAAPLPRGPLTLTSSGPTVVLARPGATTVLLTQRVEPPLPGASANASGGAVRPLRSPRESNLNPQTLLPRPEGTSR